MKRIEWLAVVSFLSAMPAIGRADDRAAEAAAVKSAKVTPVQAVEMALKEVKGGKAFELDVEAEEGVPHYEVSIALFGDRHRVWVGCETGDVIKHSSRGDIRLGLIKWKKLVVPMTKAMETAAAKFPGQIVDVDLVSSVTSPKFKVEIFTDGKVMEVEVDTQTGSIVKIEQDDD